MSKSTVAAASPLKSYPSSYSDIASEYYDPQRHPTCANFRECSAIILRQWLNTLILPGSAILETGAGASLAAELIENLKLQAILILSDLSEAMLEKSTDCTAELRLLTDAEELSFRSRSVDAVVASLGDPYNTRRFWEECARVLKPGGRVLFTTPSFEWAHSFRDETGAPRTVAEFETADGLTLFLPSYILPPTAQEDLIRSANLQIQDVVRVESSAIRHTRKSPKLRSGPVVTGYLACCPLVPSSGRHERDRQSAAVQQRLPMA